MIEVHWYRMRFQTCIAVVIAAAIFPLTLARADNTNAPLPSVELQGRVVCLSEEMRQKHGAQVPDQHQHDYGFKTDSGRYYSLVHTPLAEALLTDTNVQAKLLIVKGRVFPQTQLLEVTGRFRSISAGKTNDLFYYCDTCSIESSFPGLCACCRDPMHLVEQPVAAKPQKR